MSRFLREANIQTIEGYSEIPADYVYAKMLQFLMLEIV